MRKKFIWFVLGAVVLLLCTKLKSQNFVNEEMGVSIQFDGKPTQDTSSFGKQCSSYKANSSNIGEFLQICDYDYASDMSDDQVQQLFTDVVKKNFTITIESGTVAGYPGKTFSGNKIVDEGTGGYIRGEVTNVRQGAGTRVYLVVVVQTVPLRKASGLKKMDSQAQHFLNTLKILSPPTIVATQAQPVAQATPPPAAQAATPPATGNSPLDAITNETLADLSPPATQQETDFYNKLKAEPPEKVNAFIETRQWFRSAYAQDPHFKYGDVDLNKMPPIPKGYSNDFAFTLDEKLLGILTLALSSK